MPLLVLRHRCLPGLARSYGRKRSTVKAPTTAANAAALAASERQNAPIAAVSSMNCDGLTQMVAKPRASWAGTADSAWSRSATASGPGKTPRVPPTYSSSSGRRPAAVIAAASGARSPAGPSGLKPLPYRTRRAISRGCRLEPPNHRSGPPGRAGCGSTQMGPNE